MRRNLLACLAAVALPVAGLTISPNAAACGGTFCDNPGANQPPMPVDQTGENILFARRGNLVQAHVQIQYSGDPERFAWVVPVPEIPELSVGSQQLFVNMLNATVPTYQVTNTNRSCGGRTTSSPRGGCGMSLTSGDSLGTTLDGERPEEENTVGAVTERRESVGAFDVTIISATSAADISTWLEDNDFLDEPAAAPVLTDYIDQGYHFVAVKLRPGVGVDEIHPLVIEYPGTEPCIPLKLTAIAAAEDMGVRAFFLGDSQVVPYGEFRHVTLNDAHLDLISPGSNYQDVVSRAVDAEGAFGLGFVTEYAGPPDGVDLTDVHSDFWDPTVFETAQPQSVVGILNDQGLADCWYSTDCNLRHPLLLSLLREHLPAPLGIDEGVFYSCLSCYPDDLPDPWDGAAFAADYTELILQPAERARDLVQESAYLTRLFTTISPDEMTVDPMFVEAADPPADVDVQRDGTLVNSCGERSAITDYGHEISVDPATWPLFGMTSAQRIDQYDENGELVGTVDNSEEIASQIKLHNQARGFDPDAPPPGTPEAEDESGCACRAAGRKTDGRAVFFLATLLAAAYRRRKHRR